MSHQNVFIEASSLCLWVWQLACWHWGCGHWLAWWHHAGSPVLQGTASQRYCTGLLCCWKALLVIYEVKLLAQNLSLNFCLTYWSWAKATHIVWRWGICWYKLPLQLMVCLSPNFYIQEGKQSCFTPKRERNFPTSTRGCTQEPSTCHLPAASILSNC